MKAISIKTVLATLILTGLASNAFAYDAQINITGELTESTCLIRWCQQPSGQERHSANFVQICPDRCRFMGWPCASDLRADWL